MPECQSAMSAKRRYLEVPRPDGEVYEDGSRDLLAAIEHPSLYPTDAAKIDLHVDGHDIALSRDEVEAVMSLLPMALVWLHNTGGEDA